MTEAIWGIGGTLGGFVLSVLWWYLVTHVYSPRLEFSKDVSLLKDVTGRITYRVKVKNAGHRRGIIDLTITFKVRYPGISKWQSYGSMPNNTNSIKLSVPDSHVLELRSGKSLIVEGTTDDLLSQAGNALVLTALYPRPEHRQVLDLESLLKRSVGAYLQVQVLCYDQWSGARKLFSSPPYQIENIIPGIFRQLSVVGPKKRIEAGGA